MYYFTTTICAVILGIILVISIQPGVIDSNVGQNITEKIVSRPVLTSDTLMDLVRNLFPPNIVQATIAQYRTILIVPKVDKNGLIQLHCLVIIFYCD